MNTGPTVITLVVLVTFHFSGLEMGVAGVGNGGFMILVFAYLLRLAPTVST